MYKLMVVAGPNRGTTYAIQEGENGIGRQAGNVIVLQSSRVSKRHCVLIVDNTGITVKDQGSSNGTFVNGVLTRNKKIEPGDRISVGEFVLEVARPSVREEPAPPVHGFGNVFQFPVPQGRPSLPQGPGSSQAPNFPNPNAPADFGSSPVMGPGIPTDLKGKIFFYFEAYVMPVFYGWNIKNEWKVICIGVFAAFILLNAVITINPMLDSNRATIVRENAKRARFMAKLIGDRNAPYLAARAETKTDIGFIENMDGVKLAVLTDLENRVIAPASKLNQYLVAGDAAKLAAAAAKAFRSGQETGLVREVPSSNVVAVEPVKVFSPGAGRNIPVGMAIVELDTSLDSIGVGEMSSIYSQTLVFSGLLGALVLLILYRLTLKPFQILNEDMDKVLKGDMTQVSHDFKWEELNSLWDLINSTLQRIPKGKEGDLGGSQETGPSVEEYLGPFQMLSSLGKTGLALCDRQRKIAYINPMFEEITGIRAESAVGQEFSDVARDQSWSAFTSDLFDRVQAGSEGISENYDFSGTSHKVSVTAFGTSGGAIRCYAFVLTRNEEG